MRTRLLIAATNSSHKVKEIKAMLPLTWELKSLKDVGYHEEIIEDGKTLEENALIKAKTLHQFLGKDVFAEDTGLEVKVLKGDPGVHTARYAGEQRKDADNIQLLLDNLENQIDRRARFRTVIALIYNNEEHLFEGIVEGKISDKEMGDGGFGYDPVFIPEGYEETFANLPVDIKNSISHRARAVQKLIEFLKKEDE